MKTIKDAIQAVNAWLKEQATPIFRQAVANVIAENLTFPSLTDAGMEISIKSGYALTDPFEVFVGPSNESSIGDSRIVPVAEKILVLDVKKRRVTYSKSCIRGYGYEIGAVSINSDSILQADDSLNEIIQKAFFRSADMGALPNRITNLTTVLSANVKMKEKGLTIADVKALYRGIKVQEQLLDRRYDAELASDGELLSLLEEHAKNLATFCERHSFPCPALTTAISEVEASTGVEGLTE